MAYTVLARRYRSQSFSEVIGQDAIAQTLLNAIKSQRVAHAYLFVGTRGVGKTTSARLFAKALNGGTPELDEAIMKGSDTDVIEIDAASNTGVDDARELIANSAYKPLRGKYKVYIIDEVHMLSTNAFNALLKTMEEPPAHVVFILCTTDVHKVPTTIQSRCQRFEFRAIPLPMIAAHLTKILGEEKVTADEDLVYSLARMGNGSMRDALSITDRLLASGEKHLTVKLLETLLGLPERELMSGLLDAIVSGNPGTAIEKAGAVLSKGTSIEQAIEVLLVRLRDLLVLFVCGEATALVELSEQAKKEEHARARRFEAAAIVHMIALCESVLQAVKRSSVPRALFDALMVRMAITDRIADAAAIVQAGGAVGATVKK
jgi:DNA polymerase III subunit gamma/tau